MPGLICAATIDMHMIYAAFVDVYKITADVCTMCVSSFVLSGNP